MNTVMGERKPDVSVITDCSSEQVLRVEMCCPILLPHGEYIKHYVKIICSFKFGLKDFVQAAESGNQVRLFYHHGICMLDKSWVSKAVNINFHRCR
jgi:hypothetical protein